MVLLDVLKTRDGVDVVERIVLERDPEPVVQDVVRAGVVPTFLRVFDHHGRHVDAHDLGDRVAGEHRFHDPADARTQLEHMRALGRAGVGEQQLEEGVSPVVGPLHELQDRDAVVNPLVQGLEGARTHPCLLVALRIHLTPRS